MNRQKRNFLKLAGFLSLTTALPRWSWAQTPVLTGSTMGTSYRIHIRNRPEALYLRKLKRQIENLFETTESLMSLYRRDSELSRINRSENTDWQPVSNHTRRVLKTALSVRIKSDGAYNPFTGLMVKHWGFGSGGLSDKGVNSPALKNLVKATNDAKLDLGIDALRKSQSGTQLDLNGIAKGYTVDRITTLLESQGVDHFLIEIGGEIFVRGDGPDGDGWRIGIVGPNNNIVTVLQLSNQAVATSGDHIHYYMLNNRRYSHLIDPRTGTPIRHDLALVSVLASNVMQADAWSTALMIMGPEKGQQYAMENSMAALFLTRHKDGLDVMTTPAYQNHLVEYI
ncbi:MAG: thiamine biosynthesis lipoprotein [Parasphingorhabdus sp.]|jgi:thiamine biosynthesis lipoprotein